MSDALIKGEYLTPAIRIIRDELNAMARRVDGTQNEADGNKFLAMAMQMDLDADLLEENLDVMKSLFSKACEELKELRGENNGNI